MCSATFSGPFSATSKCELSAVFASTTMQTSIAVSGMLSGTNYTWQGLSFDIDGRPTDGTYDLVRAANVVGELGDGVSDTWSISGGAGMPATGTLSFGVSDAKIAASVAAGDVYDLQGSGSARMKYTGSRSGVADLIVTIAY